VAVCVAGTVFVVPNHGKLWCCIYVKFLENLMYKSKHLLPTSCSIQHFDIIDRAAKLVASRLKQAVKQKPNT